MDMDFAKSKMERCPAKYGAYRHEGILR
jgi:hypothetical protein